MEPVQRVIVEAILGMLTGHEPDLTSLAPADASTVAARFAHRDERFRHDVVHAMELVAIVAAQITSDELDHIESIATALGVGVEFLDECRERATGTRGLVAGDIDRSTYVTHLDLSTSVPDELSDLCDAADNEHAWTVPVINGAIAERWRRLADLPEGTLGRAVTEFYQARGFVVPGAPGSVPPLLSQHDWVHVLADFGTKVESEIEVFGFIAAASGDPEAFTLLVMAVELFQTGELPAAAGIFEPDPGHLEQRGMPIRLADAMRRGRQCAEPVDYLTLDFLEMAERTVESVRQQFSIGPASAAARAAGTVGPFEPGGISPFQLNAGQQAAAARGEVYRSFGASVDPAPSD
jgi:hypothetical protein